MLTSSLNFSRTVHSLVEILCHFSFIRLILIAPAGLELPQEYENLARSNNIEVIISSNLEEIVPQVDVLYVTRIQRERFSDLVIFIFFSFFLLFIYFLFLFFNNKLIYLSFLGGI